MPYLNDRRKHVADPDEALSPEFLAMLVACGGEVRAEDRQAVSQAGVEQNLRRRADDDAGSPTEPSAENRLR